MTISATLLFVLFMTSVSGLILPMTKPNGDPDSTSIINHVTLMEQRMEQTITSVQAELITVKTNLKTAEDELKTLKADLKSAETEIAILKHDMEKDQVTVDITNLKSEMENLKQNHFSSVQQKNLTVIDSIRSDVKSNMREIQSLSSKQNNTEMDMTSTKSLVQSAVSDVKTVLTQVTKISADVNSVSQQILVLTNRTDDTQYKQNVTNQALTATSALAESTSAEVTSIKFQVNTISGDLNGVVSELKGIKNRTEAGQSKENITDQELTATKAIVQSTSAEVKSIKSKVNSVSADLNAIHQALATDKQRNDVAFQVTERGPGWYSAFTALIFDTVDYNAGNGYNQTSGVFTAPVSGTYIFWANVQYRSEGTDKWTYIIKGQHKLAQEVNNNKPIAVTSTMVVSHLRKGDEIHFTTNTNDNEIGGEGDSSYGGALLHAV